MAKKKSEKDVLIVRDEKTGEISVVAGLDADGSPKRTPAKAENAQSFLQFDRHGDVLDNFFKNFFRQCKEPSRFGFYRVAADQADKLMEVMKDLLKDPEANKELLAPHKVDTSGYEKQVKEEQTAGKTEQTEQKQEEQPKENQKQEEMEKKQESPQQQTQGRRGYQPIDESKINWQELEEKWGVKRADLEKSGDLTKMLNYGKSDLVKVSPKFGGEAFELDARLSFKKDGEGNISLVPHFIRKEQKLDEYKEHKFSDEDRKNLRETGNLGRVVDIVDRETGEIIPSFISIDRKTNEITDIPANKVRIPERIGKTEITKQEQDMLRAGLPVRDKLIERNDGRKFVTTLQVNVEQRGVEFVPGTGKSPRTAQTQEAKNNPTQGQAQGMDNSAAPQKEQRRNTWTNADGSIRPISKWSGVNFTDQQKADYAAGKAIKLENVTDKQGFHATMYIKFTESGSVSLITDYDDGLLKLIVEDTGTGMTEEEQRRVFGAFERLSNAATKDGFGLGLSIVQRIVAMLGGVVRLESEKGKGSCFTVEIPMQTAEEQPEQSRQGYVRQNEAYHEVIAIDNDAVLLPMLKEMYAQEGIHCDTCTDAAELIELIRKKEYSLLLTDLNMPDINGFELLELLRTSNVGNSRDIPVVVTTASGSCSKEELMDRGFTGCLLKPFSISELMEISDKCAIKSNQNEKPDFTSLLSYGNEAVMLEKLIAETEKEMQAVREAELRKDLQELDALTHHLRSSWEILRADQPLRELYKLLHGSTDTDHKALTDAVTAVLDMGADIIRLAKEERRKYNYG